LNLESIIAVSMDPTKVTTAYPTVTVRPKSDSSRAMITGFSTGDEKRKAMVGPKGTPPLSSPAVIGTVEQEQKGVSTPRPEPHTYCTHVNLFAKKSRILDGGRYSIKSPITNDTATNIRISSLAITRKNLPAVMKLLKANIMIPSDCLLFL